MSERTLADLIAEKSAAGPPQVPSGQRTLSDLITERKTPVSDTPMDTATDALVGAGSGITMDFDDEIAGALSAIASMDASKYTTGRDDYRARKELAASRSPIANMGGQLAGAVGAGLLTGGVGAEAGAAKVAGRLALEGAAQGIGAEDSGRGEIADLGDLVGGAAKGAGTALAVGGLAKVAGKGVGRFLQGAGEEEAQRAANRARVAQVGLAPEQIERMPGKVAGQASRLRKYGIGEGLPGPEQIESKVYKAIDQVEADRKAIAGQLTKARVPGRDIAAKLKALKSKIPNEDSGGAGLHAEIDRMAENFAGRDGSRSLSFAEANAKRAAYGNQNWALDSQPAQFRKAIHAAINDSMEAAAEAQSPGMGRAWRELGRDENALIMAREGIDATLGRAAKAQNPGAVQQVGGAMAAMQGGPVAGLAYVAGSGAIRSRNKAVRAALAEGQVQVAKYLKGNKTTSTLGRVLERVTDPVASSLARVLAGEVQDEDTYMPSIDSDAGYARVQNAAQAGGHDLAAQAHFIESQTNPAYNQDVLDQD